MATRNPGEVSRSEDGSPSSPESDNGYRKHVAKLVYSELLEANAPLTIEDLLERTLLPAPEVKAAIAALRSRGLCTARHRDTDRRPARYVATNSR